VLEVPAGSAAQSGIVVGSVVQRDIVK